jgi:LDH2 family malate/lactate/ureidoglycolate dehydrogenase
MDQSTRTKESAGEEVRILAAELTAFVMRAFIAAGLPDADAQTVAGLMVEADLRGSDTHGVIRLPLYVRRLRAGGINAKANIRVMNESTSVALIDGDNAMGHLVMHEAALLAIEKAKATGIGWVGARMSNHAGPAALYVTQPLDHDMIGLYFALGSNNHLPPWGGSESAPIRWRSPFRRLRSRRSCSTWPRPLPPMARCGSRRSAAKRCRSAG